MEYRLQPAKAVVDAATGPVPEEEAEPRPADEGKNPAPVALVRLGGKKGGKRRAPKLTREWRSEIARKAARARWKKSD